MNEHLMSFIKPNQQQKKKQQNNKKRQEGKKYVSAQTVRFVVAKAINGDVTRKDKPEVKVILEIIRNIRNVLKH